MIVPRLTAALWRGGRRWYVSTAVVLAIALAVLQGVVGLMDGVEAQTEERVADFYTGDLRVATGPGAAPSGHWQDLDGVAEGLGVAARGQFESQVVLSRQGFVEAVLFEREGFDVDAPGRESGAPLTAGVVLGIREDAREALAPHMVSGDLPIGTPYDPDEPIPLAMSLTALERALTPEEQGAMRWPPAPADLAGLHFQVTAARLADNETLAEGGDLILRTGRVVGVFDTDIDILDRFTVLAPIEAVRDLHGLDPFGNAGNVLLVEDPAPGLAADAEDDGLEATDAATFTRAQVGQLLDALRWLGAIAAASLLVLPTFLVLHGLGRQLDAHRHELGVMHAIGLGGRALGTALLALVGAVVVSAAVVAPALAWLLGTGLGPRLATAQGWPLPYGHVQDPAWAVGSALLALGLAAVAWAIALGAHLRQDLPAMLRTG